jgi:hypothetical protein
MFAQFILIELWKLSCHAKQAYDNLPCEVFIAGNIAHVLSAILIVSPIDSRKLRALSS